MSISKRFVMALVLILAPSGLVARATESTKPADPKGAPKAPAAKPNEKPSDKPAAKGDKGSEGSNDPATAPELNAKTPKEFVLHKAADTGATLRSPKSWQEAELTSPGVKLNLIADKKGRSVNLVVKDVPAEASVKEAVEILPKLLAKDHKDFKLIKADFVKLSGAPAGRIVYQAEIEGKGQLRFCQLFEIKGTALYILTYTSPADDFDELLPTVEQVAVSLRVK